MEELLMTLGSGLAPHNVPSIYPVAKEPSKNSSKEKNCARIFGIHKSIG